MHKPSFTNTAVGTAIFAIAPLIFTYSQSGAAGAGNMLLSFFYWLFILYYLGIYILLECWVMPRLYFPQKSGLMLLVFAALFVATVFVRPFDRLIHSTAVKPSTEKQFNLPPADGRPGEPGHERFNNDRRREPMVDIVSIFLLLIVVLLVISDFALKSSRRTEERALRAEAGKAQAELSFLKAQINPHFLFNTLNNIYSLAVTKSEATADSIMKLSNIMRYITDEGNETMVPLQDEIDCINDYISLQKLRLGEDYMVSFEMEGQVMGKKLPPLVLMTFVENAFKHGVSNHEKSSILFKIVAGEKYIHFFAENKLFNIPRNTERTGVGIANTRKRLEVLYPEKHLLKITEEAPAYIVELVLYN